MTTIGAIKGYTRILDNGLHPKAASSGRFETACSFYR